MKTIGIWISEKKSRKFNWLDFIKACNSHGYQVYKLDIEKNLEDQAPIHVLLHKLSDILAAAMQGDSTATEKVNRIEHFLSNHPEITVIDPLDNVRILMNRNRYYTILNEVFSYEKDAIYTPSFVEFTTDNLETNIKLLFSHGVTYPMICKPTVAHGSEQAHQMMLIFNERGLKRCRAPCVLQSFVNHNAVLYKVFVVGNKFHVIQRPSLKNFYPSEEREPILFTSSEVCKADSQSTLSNLDPDAQVDHHATLEEDKVHKLIQVLRLRIGLLLVGFDVVINNANGKHAVIDINMFPSYDVFPNLFEHLLECVNESVMNNSHLGNTEWKKDCDKPVNVCDQKGDALIKGMNVSSVKAQ